MKPLSRLIPVIALACGAAFAAAPAFAQTTPPKPATQAADEVKPQPVDVFQGAGLLIFKTPDNKFQWWFDGRIQLDAAVYSNSDNTLANGAEVRRARLGFNFKLYEKWTGQFDVDYADNAIEMKDMWLGYSVGDHGLFKVGNFKEPFGLESLISSRYISFIERPFLDNFTPDRHLGFGYTHFGPRWQATGTAYAEPAGTVEAGGVSQGYGVAGRVTFLPWVRGNSLVHVGVAGAYQTPDAADAGSVRLRARPETHINRERFVDTGKVKNVDHTNLMGFEGLTVLGRFSAQGEFARDSFVRTSSALPTPHFDSWYAHASLFLTNDHRPYDTTFGELDRVIPSAPRGALEVLVRYSTVNLTDAATAILGGKENSTTLGMNYYFNPDFRLMVNYSFIRNDANAKASGYKPNDNFNILQARFQVNF